MVESVNIKIVEWQRLGTRRRLFPQPEEVLGHLDRRDPFSPSCATNHRGLLQLRDDNADESEGGV
jgi:hypothetical protein